MEKFDVILLSLVLGGFAILGICSLIYGLVYGDNTFRLIGIWSLVIAGAGTFSTLIYLSGSDSEEY